MTVTIDLGQILFLCAAIFGTAFGFMRLAAFIKQWWTRPVEPGER